MIQALDWLYYETIIACNRSKGTRTLHTLLGLTLWSEGESLHKASVKCTVKLTPQQSVKMRNWIGLTPWNVKGQKLRLEVVVDWDNVNFSIALSRFRPQKWSDVLTCSLQGQPGRPCSTQISLSTLNRQSDIQQQKSKEEVGCTNTQVRDLLRYK